MSTYRPAGGGRPQITPGDIDRRTRAQLRKGLPVHKPKQPPEIQFADIEAQFTLAAFGQPPSAVGRSRNGGYWIRILVGTNVDIFGQAGVHTDKFDYFYTDPDGVITTAPRGHAKDYRPGRIPVDQLDAAVTRYTNQKGQS
jgi:hypothetical protein